MNRFMLFFLKSYALNIIDMIEINTNYTDL